MNGTKTMGLLHMNTGPLCRHLRAPVTEGQRSISRIVNQYVEPSYSTKCLASFFRSFKHSLHLAQCPLLEFGATLFTQCIIATLWKVLDPLGDKSRAFDLQ